MLGLPLEFSVSSNWNQLNWTILEPNSDPSWLMLSDLGFPWLRHHATPTNSSCPFFLLLWGARLGEAYRVSDPCLRPGDREGAQPPRNLQHGEAIGYGLNWESETQKSEILSALVIKDCLGCGLWVKNTMGSSPLQVNINIRTLVSGSRPKRSTLPGVMW
jgi:hypothetical protein